MTVETLNLKVVIILTIGFALASLLGYLTQRIKLSPLLGYLLAGYAIGPFSPGFVADLELAEQLAEVGVMLMMFGVGLHFEWRELASVKRIAIPGAIGQTLVATVAAALAVHYIWGSWEAGVIFGLAIGVASTVVLVRVLSDNKLLHTLEGHISVGWLIVEDIVTVAVLILLPTIVGLLSGNEISLQAISKELGIVFIKFIALAAFLFTIGRKCVSYALLKAAQTRSPELFTLTVLSLTFLIATGSALLIGTSIALGAFLAGMVIGQTDLRHQASAYASPLKDVFVVIFFLSVGMLFNPAAIFNHFPLFLGILIIILVIKPLAAYLIVIAMRYPAGVALSVAFALAQIGEFSFILAEEAGKYQIFPDEGYDIIVACALISIAINPLLFKLLQYLKPALKQGSPLELSHVIDSSKEEGKLAIIVGFGSIGQDVYQILEESGYRIIIIENDVDVATKLRRDGREAIFGDASFPDMLQMAHIESASLLIITLFDFNTVRNIIHYARDIHPEIVVVAGAQNGQEQNLLHMDGIYSVCKEEEVNHAFETLVAEIS